MKEKQEYQDQVEGRNSVLELLESGKDINKIYVQAGEKHGSIYKIIAMAKERKVLINEIDKNKKVGALKIAEDATYIDTSLLTIDEVCAIILSKIHL